LSFSVSQLIALPPLLCTHLSSHRENCDSLYHAACYHFLCV
jgi:hypothetical protein